MNSQESQDVMVSFFRWFVRKEHPVTRAQMWVYDQNAQFWDKKYEGVPKLW